MRKLLSYLTGLGWGIVTGMLLVTFFSPVSGDELRSNFRQHHADSMAAARKAAAEKRAELKQELEEMKQPRQTPASTE